MNELYEESDLVNFPFQCFYCDSARHKFPIAPHWHYYTEIILVLKGVLRVQADNTEYILHEDEMLLLHSKSVHAFYPVDRQPILLAGVKLNLTSFNFTDKYAPRLDHVFHAAHKKGMTIFFEADYTREAGLASVFRNCNREIRQMEYGYNIMINSQLCQLLVSIVRYWQRHGFVIDRTVLEASDDYDIFNILPYISAHLDTELKVSDIAKHCGLSYSYFAKRFQEIHGISCKKYIEDMRVYKAEELLLFTDFDLTTISQITGFSDCSHLIKSFKQRRNITPKQFRIRNSTHPNNSFFTSEEN